MKRIIKGLSPDFFEDWKTDYLIRNSIQATYTEFIGEPKQQLKRVLYDEQLGLCCYCCKAVTYPYANSQDSHIEHFKPKSVKPYDILSLDYSNLHLSCSGYKNSRDSCGHKKDDWYDACLTVSPLEEDVEQLFEYSIDGHILAKNANARADTTIKKMNLDSFALQRLRKTAIYICGLFDPDFDHEKADKIIVDYNAPSAGSLKSFCNAVVYCVANA